MIEHDMIGISDDLNFVWLFRIHKLTYGLKFKTNKIQTRVGHFECKMS
jgi:hypothetical protein